LILIWPINQNISHLLVGDFPASPIPYDSLQPILSQSVFDWDVLLAIFTLVGIFWLGFKLWKNYRLLSFCIGWFFISLLPVSFIIPHGSAFQEKFLYIPSFGVILFFIYGCLVLLNLKSLNHFHQSLQTTGITLLVLVISGFSWLTITRNTIWKDDISLWLSVVDQDPTNLLANYNLSIYYVEAGQLSEGEKHYQVAYVYFC